MTNHADTNQKRPAIRNCRQLRQAIARGCHEFRLLLAGGLCFSRKHITLDEDSAFVVINDIDGSVQTLTGRQLYTESNLGRGIKCGALVTEG